jgi:hypothetical protein
MQNKYFKDFYKNNKLEYVFEIYGIDFLLDINLNTYLIDFNTTPGLLSKYELINIIEKKEGITFNMLIMIILKLLKLYNKNKKFINKNNKDKYIKIYKKFKFKNNFDKILNF